MHHVPKKRSNLLRIYLEILCALCIAQSCVVYSFSVVIRICGIILIARHKMVIKLINYFFIICFHTN
jgi:hypothetical protein